MISRSCTKGMCPSFFEICNDVTGQITDAVLGKYLAEYLFAWCLGGITGAYSAHTSAPMVEIGVRLHKLLEASVRTSTTQPLSG